MQTWLRTLPRLEKRSKSSRKNRRSRSAWRSNFDARDFGIERLEDRVLLTVDLAVTKTAAPAIATVGSPEVYSVVVTNNGTTATTGLTTVTDTLPANINPLTVTATDTGMSGAPVVAPGTVTDTIPIGFAAGASATLTISVTPTVGPTLVNTATAVDAIDTSTGTAATTTPVGGSIVGTTVDLSVTKTAASNPATVGTPEVYTVVVKNNSTTTGATGVTLIDTLPANANAYTTSAGTITGNVLTDSIGNLAAGASATVTVSVTPTAGPTLVNTAAVAGNEVDSNLLNNVAATTTPVGGSIVGTTVDLSVTKTAASNPATVGTPEVYTVVVKNNSTTTGATGVTLIDTLPVNANAYTTSAGTITGNVLTDAIGSLAAGASTTVTVSVTPMAAASGGTLVNTASVAGNEVDSNLLNNVAVTTTPVGGVTTTATVDLSVTKTAASNPATVGTPEVYTVVVKNNSTTTGATGVTLVDTLPINANAYTTSAGTITGNVLTDAIGSLAAGASATVTVSVTPTAGPTLVNTAVVAGNEADNNLLNNVAATTTPVGGSIPGTTVDLSVTKTPASNPAIVGTAEVYTIVVKNNSTTTGATGVTLVDTLPTNANAYTTSAGTITGNVLTDAIGNLAAGASTTVTVSVTATAAAAGGSLVNTASVAGNEADNNLLNNVVTTTTPVTTPASLTITKLGPPTGTVGTSLTYTITISNIGGAATTAGAATVSDTLPAGLTLVSAVDTAGMVTVSPGSNSFTDSLGALAAATGTETIIVTATPTSALSGQTVTNTATLTFNATTQTSSATTSIAGSVVVPHVCYLAGVPGDGTARTFITNLYHELLGREPDAPSMTAFLNYLAQHDNIVGRHTVEEMFLNSPEYAAHYVSCLYEIFLGRSVDAGGLAFWTQKMGQVGNLLGHTGSADEKYILAAILGSTEYYNNAGGTAQGWINALYQDLLGRSADSGGTTFWTTLLGLHGGDRDGIARDLLSTPEAVHDLLFGSIPGAGTAAHPLPANGMPAGQGGTKLDEYTGGGYVNLYFQGAGLVGGLLDTVDQIFGDLVGDYSWNPVASVVSWDTAISLALATPLYYTNPARPVVAATTS
ncbi:MAG TPA: DUF4214 domain-containing protein [Pirellulales bacterium]|nr:DUF4214 domain-containing protein [Pirellulales bacterium]